MTGVLVIIMLTASFVLYMVTGSRGCSSFVLARTVCYAPNGRFPDLITFTAKDRTCYSWTLAFILCSIVTVGLVNIGSSGMSICISSVVLVSAFSPSLFEQRRPLLDINVDWWQDGFEGGGQRGEGGQRFTRWNV